MPIIKVENGYVYKKTTKNSKGAVKFLLILFLVSIFISVICFYSFSKFDVVKSLNLNRFLVFEQKKYYVVHILENDSFDNCFLEADEIKRKGGAGYVLNFEGDYYLTLCAFESKNDAENVAENLDEYSAYILEITLEKMVVSTSFSQKQLKILKDSLNYVNLAFSTLNQISLSLDKGEIFDAEARQKLQVFKETCQYAFENFNNIFQNNFENIVTRVKIFQNEIISNLVMLYMSKNLSADLKYFQISILDSFLSLQKNALKN